MTREFPPFDEFLKMEDQCVASLVSSSVAGRAGILVPDGNRKAALVFWGFDPSKEDFDKDINSKIHPKFLEVIKIFFKNGVKALYIPLLSQKNFERGKTFMNASLYDGLKHVFHDIMWLSFYDECNIRVQFYGDREFLRQKGYTSLIDWMQALEERTAINTSATLFLGVASDRSREEVRLVSMGIEHYKRLGRTPTRAELITAYYRIDAPEIGFMVRPTEVRDSDSLPILVSGYNTQMYFPVISAAFLSKIVIRSILYDAIVTRGTSHGTKLYSRGDIDSTDIKKVKEYYEMNYYSVLGLGLRKGPFWLPSSQVKMPSDGTITF
ncbi:MAG: undecaprenyl diphosphate synthase family protein [Theionarchaea archaeon]|nr:undecaprenyl diphosphate synthase family protein [Theionarchaea archaeon]